MLEILQLDTLNTTAYRGRPMKRDYRGGRGMARTDGLSLGETRKGVPPSVRPAVIFAVQKNTAKGLSPSVRPCPIDSRRRLAAKQCAGVKVLQRDNTGMRGASKVGSTGFGQGCASPWICARPINNSEPCRNLGAGFLELIHVLSCFRFRTTRGRQPRCT